MAQDVVALKAAQVAHSLEELLDLASQLSIPGASSDRFRISWALLRASVDDGRAICHLLQHQPADMAGPAFTLLRPMNESFRRGAWFGLYGTEAAVERFLTNDVAPRNDRLVADLESEAPFSIFRIFSGLYENAGPRLHSFTHGGSQLVRAYLLDEEVHAHFPADEIVFMLSHVEAIAVTVVHVMCMIAGEFDREVSENVLDELVERFQLAC